MHVPSVRIFYQDKDKMRVLLSSAACMSILRVSALYYVYMTRRDVCIEDIVHSTTLYCNVCAKCEFVCLCLLQFVRV